MNDALIPIDTVQSAGRFSKSGTISLPSGQSSRGSEMERPTALERAQGIPPGHWFGPTAAPSQPSGQILHSEEPGPSSAYLAMVLNDLRSTLRMAEAFRQTVAVAQPPAVYARYASKVYALEIRAQQEISRLRSEGLPALRQWFA